MKALLVISANNTSSKHHISEHINEQAISIYFPSLLQCLFCFGVFFFGKDLAGRFCCLGIKDIFVFIVSEVDPAISIVVFHKLALKVVFLGAGELVLNI